MDAQTEQSPIQLFFNVLKVIGFIIWALLPLTFSLMLNLYQDATPELLHWVLAGLWLAFVFFSIRWIWSYYLKIYPDPQPKMRGKDIGIAIGLFVFLRVLAVVGTTLNQSIYGNLLTSNDEALFGTGTSSVMVIPIYFLLFNFTIGIFAPIIEELVFRGIFTNLLFSPRAKWLPAIITSAVFSLLHGMDNIITFSMYFIMGLTFFWAYKRRGAIKDAILLHILNNILAMIYTLVTYFLYY